VFFDTVSTPSGNLRPAGVPLLSPRAYGKRPASTAGRSVVDVRDDCAPAPQSALFGRFLRRLVASVPSCTAGRNAGLIEDPRGIVTSGPIFVVHGPGYASLIRSGLPVQAQTARTSRKEEERASGQTDVLPEAYELGPARVGVAVDRPVGMADRRGT
jgi:hypothetical protein